MRFHRFGAAAAILILAVFAAQSARGQDYGAFRGSDSNGNRGYEKVTTNPDGSTSTTLTTVNESGGIVNRTTTTVHTRVNHDTGQTSTLTEVSNVDGKIVERRESQTTGNTKTETSTTFDGQGKETGHSTTVRKTNDDGTEDVTIDSTEANGTPHHYEKKYTKHEDGTTTVTITEDGKTTTEKVKEDKLPRHHDRSGSGSRNLRERGESGEHGRSGGNCPGR